MKRITDARSSGTLAFFAELVERYGVETGTAPIDIAAALAKLAFGEAPVLLTETVRRDSESRPSRPPSVRRSAHGIDIEFVSYRVEVGRAHGVEPGNLVGAIANEAGLDRSHIGRIDIRDECSLIELPVGMPRDVLRTLRKVWVLGRQLHMTRCTESPRRSHPKRRRFAVSDAR
jgi:ATP-dependent RNA helicase DeaD